MQLATDFHKTVPFSVFLFPIFANFLRLIIMEYVIQL